MEVTGATTAGGRAAREARLDGRVVAITRSAQDAAEFVRLAERDNATAIPLPTIELVSKGQRIADEFLESVRRYGPDYSVFMSSKAVGLLFEAARRAGRLEELRLAVANTAVVSVGPKTTAALKSEGIGANHQPPRTFSSVGIGEVFTALGAAGKRAIIPRSGASTPFLRDLLSKIGVDVLEIHLYDVCAFRDTGQWNGFRRLFSEQGVDGIVFTSASSVRGFFEIMERDYGQQGLRERLERVPCLVSIGPFTSDELKGLGVKSITSGTHTVAGSFDTLRASLASCRA